MAPVLQAMLDQVHVDGASGRLRVPTEQGIESVSTEGEAFRRLYQTNLGLSLQDLPRLESVAPPVFPSENHSWYRQVTCEPRSLLIKADFWHESGRYLHIKVPLRLDARPEYQMLCLGMERGGIRAGVENYVQSEESLFSDLNIHMGFKFNGASIATLSSQALRMSPFSALHQIAIRLASEFYVSGRYFSPGPESRLRLLLTYQHRDRPESISLQPSREGLRPTQPIMTAGLRKFHLGSISEEGCYFSIAGDLEQLSLEVYSNLPAARGEHSLRQRPMPALLWDFITEQTDVALERGCSQSA